MEKSTHAAKLHHADIAAAHKATPTDDEAVHGPKNGATQHSGVPHGASHTAQMGDVPEPWARPQTGPHPEEIDPLGRQHVQHRSTPGERRGLFVTALCVVIAIILVPILAAVSGSPVINVFLGLSPLLLSLFAIMALRQYKPVVAFVAVVVVHLLALAYLYIANLTLFTPVNVMSAVSLSLMFAVLCAVLITLASSGGIKRVKEQEPVDAPDFEPAKIEEYIQAIEDKCKALNFAIGRVYRNSNGSNPRMRERLRIPREWYNEFTQASGEEREGMAKIVVDKIRDRLRVYGMREMDVFTATEMESLKNIQRDKHGKDLIVDVLAKNDSDPVAQTYASAVSFCDKIIKELEK
jgi:hypothetical protein